MSEPTPLLREFLSVRGHVCRGRRTQVQRFVAEFQRWLGPDKDRWDRKQIVEAIDELIANDLAWSEVCRGVGSDNLMSLGNVELPDHAYHVHEGNLRRIVI